MMIRIPDLMWMEDTLHNVFGFPVPLYDIIDKCAGSLATFAESVKESWAVQSEAIRPEGDDEERAVSVQSETRVGCA